MAAHLESKGCTTLDFTGLSQKNGAVLSHIRIAGSTDNIAAVRIAPGGADLLLGCDLVVAASGAALSRLQAGYGRAIVNAELLPTASFVINPDVDLTPDAMRRALSDAVGDNGLDLIEATRLARGLTGNSLASNAFLLGYAHQKGLDSAGKGLSCPGDRDQRRRRRDEQDGLLFGDPRRRRPRTRQRRH